MHATKVRVTAGIICSVTINNKVYTLCIRKKYSYAFKDMIHILREYTRGFSITHVETHAAEISELIKNKLNHMTFSEARTIIDLFEGENKKKYFDKHISKEEYGLAVSCFQYLVKFNKRSFQTMLKHNETSDYNKYYLPGGGIRGKIETEFDAAVRETHEEACIQSSVLEFELANGQYVSFDDISNNRLISDKKYSVHDLSPPIRFSTQGYNGIIYNHVYYKARLRHEFKSKLELREYLITLHQNMDSREVDDIKFVNLKNLIISGHEFAEFYCLI